MTDSARILVVEDDLAIQRAIEMILADEGYAVTSASTGAAALELVPQFQPSLIVLDLRMPVMDGPSFVQTYHQQPGPHAPIIVVTASRAAATVGEIVEVDAVLAKPFDLDDLLRVIQQQLHPGTQS